MRVNLITIGLCLFVLNEQIMAQEGSPMSFSLKAAQEYAVKNHAMSKNAELSVRYSRKQVMETTAIGLPQISADVSYQYFMDIPTQVAPAGAFGFPDEINNIIGAVAVEKGLPLPPAPEEGQITEFQFGTDHNASAGITINQLIFDGTYIIGLRAAKTYVALSQKQLQQTHTDIRNNVAKAYYAVLVSEENKKITGKNISSLEKIYFETNELFKNGFVEKLDVDRLELSLSNLKTQLNNVSRQSELSYSLLKFQMGMSLKDDVVVTDSLALLTGDLKDLSDLQLDLANRADYQGLLVRRDLAKLNIQRYQTNLVPSMGAFMSHSQNAYRYKFNFFEAGNWYPTTLVGFQLRIPIFGLQNTALIQQARIDHERIKNQGELMEQSIQLEVKQAKTNHKSAMNIYEAQKKNLKLAEDIYHTTLIKYNEGVGSSLEVANAQTEMFQTQGNYINTLFDLLNAKADLEKALGYE